MPPHIKINITKLTTTMEEPLAKKRKVKDLPDSFSGLTEFNFRHVLKTRIETDPKETGEVVVAYAVELEDGQVDLTTLNLDQQWKFCKKVGIQYINNCLNFQCRKALSVLAHFLEGREKDGEFLSPVDRTDTNIIRLSNIIFGHEFIDSFLSLNDAKNRVDHETGGMPGNFWNDVSDAMNGANEDDSCALCLVVKEDDPCEDKICEVHLNQFDSMMADAIKKKINKLMKMRAQVQKNMTLSGEHDSDSYNFIEVAMKTVGKSGLGVLGCYYFFKRCDERPEVDTRFSQTLDESVSGNSDDVVSPPAAVPNSASAKKKVAADAMADISNFSKEIATEMKETNRVALEANKLANRSQLIMLAQHLGKTEMLEAMLLQSFSASSGNSP